MPQPTPSVHASGPELDDDGIARRGAFVLTRANYARPVCSMALQEAVPERG